MMWRRGVLRDPEGSETSGSAGIPEKGPGGEKPPGAGEIPDGKDGAAPGAKAEGAGPGKTERTQEEREGDLFNLRRKLNENPSAELDEAELGLLDDFEAGKLEPKKRKVEGAVPGDEGGGDKAKGEGAAPQTDAEILAAALAEVGAKDLKELPTKVKELKKGLSGKTAQDVARLTEELAVHTRAADNLKLLPLALEDVAAGKPGAREWVEKTFGFKVPGGAKPAGEPGSRASEPAAGADGEIQFKEIPEGAFFTPEAGKEVNALLKSQVEALNAQARKIKELESSTAAGSAWQRGQVEAARRREANGTVSLELSALVAEPEFAELKPSSGNLLELLKDYWEGSDKDPVDPRIEPLVEVFSLAKEMGMRDYKKALRVAARSFLSKGISAKLEAAERKGRESLTRHKPSTGMSELLGSQTGEKPISDDLAEKYASGAIDAPEEWFTDGELDEKKIPGAVQRARLRLQASGRSS